MVETLTFTFIFASSLGARVDFSDQPLVSSRLYLSFSTSSCLLAPQVDVAKVDVGRPLGHH